MHPLYRILFFTLNILHKNNQWVFAILTIQVAVSLNTIQKTHSFRILPPEGVLISVPRTKFHPPGRLTSQREIL